MFKNIKNNKAKSFFSQFKNLYLRYLYMVTIYKIISWRRKEFIRLETVKPKDAPICATFWAEKAPTWQK